MVKIFVTVGTGKFETLVKEIDNIAPKLKDKITIQIGSGKYIPKNCEWFRFAPKLQKFYKENDLLIGHGGPGTVFEILDTKKRFIACANMNRTDKMHQVEFLRAISKETKSLIYCSKLNEMFKTIQIAKKTKFEKYKKPKSWIDKTVREFIDEN
ncbi:hypothetical protein HN777_00255 [Candidatus Woesearchaeota archaeon]|nr:hypothetical protein [Candidatus Woesearchaeota archaeon]